MKILFNRYFLFNMYYSSTQVLLFKLPHLKEAVRLADKAVRRVFWERMNNALL